MEETWHINDYMKIVLTKEEVESVLHPTASAEYTGNIFEFWLGMLELGIQFPTMFEGWGANLDSCLAGLEESFWLFCNYIIHAAMQIPSTPNGSRVKEGIHTILSRMQDGDNGPEGSEDLRPSSTKRNYKDADHSNGQL